MQSRGSFGANALLVRGMGMAFLFVPIQAVVMGQFSGLELGQVAGHEFAAADWREHWNCGALDSFTNQQCKKIFEFNFKSKPSESYHLRAIKSYAVCNDFICNDFICNDFKTSVLHRSRNGERSRHSTDGFSTAKANILFKLYTDYLDSINCFWPGAHSAQIR